MSPEEPDLPVHRISRAEDRERLLAEAMAHAEAQEAQYRTLPAEPPAAGRWKTPAAWAIAGLAAIVAVAPPAWLAGPDAPRPTPGERDRGLRAALYLQAQQVEAFRARAGSLPATLEELPQHFHGLVLVRSNNRVFQIRGWHEDGRLLVYDSADPAPAFEAAAGWLSRVAP